MTTFEEWYSLYPRKKARGDAKKAWDQMTVKQGNSPDDIMAGLRRNISELTRRDPQFVPYPATWLRSESWADEPDPITQRTSARRTTWDAAREINSRFDNFDAAFGFPQLAKH
jgi:hypothetical protein